LKALPNAWCLSAFGVPLPGGDEADLDEVGEFLLDQIKQRIGTRILRRLSGSDEAAARVTDPLWDDDREEP